MVFSSKRGFHRWYMKTGETVFFELNKRVKKLLGLATMGSA